MASEKKEIRNRKTHQITAGKLATEVNVNIETIRYYENIGLMPKPERLENSYRIYSNTDLRRLLFIKHSKTLGFSLKEIQELLFLKVDDKKSCDDVREIAEKKIAEIDVKLKEMKKIKNALIKLAKQCRKKTNDECPVLNEIENLV